MSAMTSVRSWLVQRLARQQLHELEQVTARMAAGDLDHPVNLGEGAGFERLAESLEFMRNNLRTSQSTLRYRNQQLQQLDHAKDGFLASVSHELRLPLQTLLANVAIAGAAPEAQQGACLESIGRNASLLLGIVDRMLDFAKLQSGNFTIERQRTELRPLLDEVVASLRPQAVARGLRLEVAMLQGAPATLHTDPLRLRQILLNVVANALKFTPSGSVTVTAAAAGGRRAQITVVDTGTGIAEKRMGELFRAGEGRHQGGLAISRELARLLGGELSVASKEGTGTTVTVVIDVGMLDVAPASGRSGPESAGTLAGSVLLVDDAVDNRKLLGIVLRKAGMEVTTAGDGEEACRAVESAMTAGRNFDVIVMDVQMPVLDGRAAAARMRGLGCKTPLVALTAHALAEDQQLCLAAGFDDYATKPITPRQLVEVVRRHLPRSA
jgi:signal transduction histidine kinase/CheY-like chemotaxis protein